MRSSTMQKSPGFLLHLAVSCVVVCALTLAFVRPAAATNGTTSAGATIHNVVKVDYKLSSTSSITSTYAVVDVTVLTVPTTATWYPATGQTVVGGAVVSYTTTLLRSNANGPDSYALTQSNGANTNADAQTLQSITTSTPQWIWGGITTQAAATAAGITGTIGFPGGSIALAGNPLVVNDTIELTTSGGVKRYTVTAITAGSKNTQAAGTASNEVYDIVTATPVSGLAADQLGSATSLVPAGTQVGEYIVVNFTLTAGNPTLPGTNGTNITNLSALGAATDRTGAAQPAATTTVTTTIRSLALTVTKTSRILASGTAPVGTAAIVPANYDSTTKTAKSGQIIEYHLTITNPATNSAASYVVITDPTPVYTTAVAGSQSSSTVTPIGGVPGASTVTAGVNTRVWETTPMNFGPIAANTDLHIVYQVTVN